MCFDRVDLFIIGKIRLLGETSFSSFKRFTGAAAQFKIQIAMSLFLADISNAEHAPPPSFRSFKIVNKDFLFRFLRSSS